MIVLPNARRLVSPPAGEPVELQEAKDHCAVRHNLDDTLFRRWVAATRIYAERLSGERFITQQWEFTYSSFPSRRDKLKIPGKPIQTVDSIEYTDDTGDDIAFGTLSGSPLAIEEYTLVRDTEAPYVALKLNSDWPTAAKIDNAVRVTVTLGYGDSPLDVPELYRAGMLLCVGHFNENREAVVVTSDNVSEIPLGIRHLLYVPHVG